MCVCVYILVVVVWTFGWFPQACINNCQWKVFTRIMREVCVCVYVDKDFLDVSD